MILVTGASGEVGRRVADLLAGGGTPVRLVSRDPASVPPRAGAVVVSADYDDTASLDRAFEGVRRAFVVSGYQAPGIRARQHKNAFDAARRAGVEHVVYLSFQGASPTSKFPMARDHFESEGYLAATGVPFTSLRDNLYLDALPHLVNPDGIIRGPAGDGLVAFVSRDDVARTVVAALQGAPASHRILDVTGPEAMSLGEAAARLSALVGRPVGYENESLEAARRWRSALGAPEWEVDTWIGSYEAIADGELAQVSETVRELTGRAPESVETYFARHPGMLAALRGVTP